MQARQVEVFRVTTRGPGDVSGLVQLIEDRRVRPEDIVAIMGKTEGNGGVNDFTREYATSALSAAMAPYLGMTSAKVTERVAFVMSGGTEGVLSPHLTVFSRRDSRSPAGAKRLSIGVAATRILQPEEIGRTSQMEETAAAVQSAMADAAISEAADVHFVQIKCPLLTAERIDAAAARGFTTVTRSTYASMAYSRAASALGVGVALREIACPVPESAILSDWSLYSRVASSSAGVETMRGIVVVLGNSAFSTTRYVIGHGLMRDALDLEGLLDAFSGLGLVSSMGRLCIATDKVVNVFAKAEASPSGAIRGFRHTMLDDTDLSATRHARAAVGALIGGVVGTGAVYVSGGAEHQGPPGGGPVAIVASV